MGAFSALIVTEQVYACCVQVVDHFPRENFMFGVQSTFELYDEEIAQIDEIIAHLLKAAHAKAIFLVDKNGQMITSIGEVSGLDITSLASLTAGNIATTGGLAKLIGEKEFSIQFHEGKNESIHLSIVAGRVILVVIFDTNSSLGLVRLRVKRASNALTQVFEAIATRQEQKGRDGQSPNPFAEITDDDIDNLFN
ncbi:MAG: roadblock/LC7 domain-containing protein [Desulfuromonadaceae bacterium]|nr:roadblock/LC7 domain-containing protein [Desulfuromonadaceae bacterium]